jgi:RimJ/RimL family protein N-acetyltransferase
MTTTIKKNVYPEISQLKLRHLAKYDFREFQASVRESKDSMSTFLDMGIELPNFNAIEFMNYYTAMLKDDKFEHFGVFHGYKMLAYTCFADGFNPAGIQIVYWVREEFLKQNIGTWTISNMVNKAWVEMDCHFVEMIIDKTNYPSRQISRKMGFEAVFETTGVKGQGRKGSGTYITYLFLNPALRLKASVWDKRAIDLIGHPCMIDKFHHLIHDEVINEHFKWKYSTYMENDLVEVSSN